MKLNRKKNQIGWQQKYKEKQKKCMTVVSFLHYFNLCDSIRLHNVFVFMCLFICQVICIILICLFIHYFCPENGADTNLPVESLKDEDELVFLSRQSQDINHF